VSQLAKREGFAGSSAADAHARDTVGVWALRAPKEASFFVGQVSQLAKREGFLVTMAPMESYLGLSSFKTVTCVGRLRQSV
jgi:hypothetical protein